MARALGRRPEELWFDYFGINHLGWLRGALDGNRDLLPDLLADPERLESIEEGRLFGADWIRAIGMIPNEYLYYFYFTARSAGGNAFGPGAGLRPPGPTGLVLRWSNTQLNEASEEKKIGSVYHMSTLNAHCITVRDTGQFISFVSIIGIQEGCQVPSQSQVNPGGLFFPIAWMPPSCSQLPYFINQLNQSGFGHGIPQACVTCRIRSTEFPLPVPPKVASQCRTFAFIPLWP